MSVSFVDSVNSVFIPRANEREATAYEQKVECVFLRTLKSPLFWTVVAATLLIAFTAVVLTGFVAMPLVIFAPIAGAGALALGFTICRNWEKLWYELSLNSKVIVSHYLGCSSWYNEITEGVILGALPLQNLGHAEQLIDKKIGAVLSMVQKFESRDSSILSVPVLEETWHAHGIDFLRIEVPDLEAPTTEQIDLALDYIHNHEKQGKITYVHCKAGIGRSATIVVCYLLKYHREEILKLAKGKDLVEAAIAYVQERRPQIAISFVQQDAIRNYFSQMS